jgi:hypothetical protein
MTQGERLMRIETLLQAKAEADDIHDKAMLKAIDEVRSDVKAIRKELDDDKADLAAIKNKGSGLLIGVGLAAGGIGAGLTKALMSWLT